MRFRTGGTNLLCPGFFLTEVLSSCLRALPRASEAGFVAGYPLVKWVADGFPEKPSPRVKEQLANSSANVARSKLPVRQVQIGTYLCAKVANADGFLQDQSLGFQMMLDPETKFFSNFRRRIVKIHSEATSSGKTSESPINAKWRTQTCHSWRRMNAVRSGTITGTL